MTALEHIGRRTVATPAQISQATAVEQARAVAEVQAAVTVAQQIPRDLDRAVEDMRDTCGRMAVAAKAFYRVPNRGEGPSVHLARELARIWGNIDYGVRELRRDDTDGVSEMQAYAWDQQTNTRSSRSFIAPHARMKGKARQKLDDLGDIYLNNQNIGARAVRECVYTVLPDWFIEEAETICRRTLENGEGVPLAERIEKMVAAFDGIGVTVPQIEDKVGRKRGQWTAADVAQMGVVFGSIRSGDTTKDDEFPQTRVTAAEIVSRRAPEPTTDQPDIPDEPGDDWPAVTLPGTESVQ